MDGKGKEKIESQKNSLIDKLINHGVYKIGRIHLFELSIPELNELYQKVLKEKNYEPKM